MDAQRVYRELSRPEYVRDFPITLVDAHRELTASPIMFRDGLSASYRPPSPVVRGCDNRELRLVDVRREIPLDGDENRPGRFRSSHKRFGRRAPSQPTYEVLSCRHR